MFGSRFTRHAGLLLVALVAVACGSEERTSSNEFETPPPTPEILSFAAEPGNIPVGERTTLTWRTRNAVAIAIADEHGNPIPVEGADLGRGSVEVQPAETTSYTLIATGAPGAEGPAWRTTTVVVLAPPADAPAVEAFTVAPAQVALGSEAVLSWKTSGATRLTVKDDAGVALDLGDTDPAEGQLKVRPTRSPTNYFLVASGPGGRATASATVDVIGLPRITHFSVDPLVPVGVGGSVQVTWSTINVDRLVIRQNGSPLLETTQASGSRAVVLTDNASFELEATGTGGTVRATALARVGPDIGAFAATERLVRAGDPVTFTWAIANADRAVLDGPGNYHLAITGAQLAAGSATVDVAAPGDFVLQAFRGDVPRSAAIAVDVTTAPRIRAVALDQSQVTAALDHPATVTLSWTQDGADTCTIYAGSSPAPGYVGFPCGATGSAEVRITASTTLRLVARNATGQHERTASVEAIPPARILAFANQPNRRVSPGDPVQLSWTVTDAVSIALEKNGAAFPVNATEFIGAASDSVDFDSVYVLTALNSLGYPTRAQMVIEAGAPELLSARAEPDFVGIGHALALRWTADGGDVLTITGPEGEVFRTTEAGLIDNGSTTILAPVVAGTYTYTVTAENGAGSASLPIVLTVSDGPMIESFTVNRPEVSLGESFVLTWSVSDDPLGNKPALTLVDDHGRTYDVSAIDPNNGSLIVTPEVEAPYTFTLTASTGEDRVVATASLHVEVTVPPFLHSLTADPELVTTEGGTRVPDVELSWTSENAVEVTLWVKDADGNLIPPAIHRVSLAHGDPQSALDSGTFLVHPTASTTYVARATNRVGTHNEKSVRVIVDPPEVVSFTSTPDELLIGGSATLSWTTNHATEVALVPTAVRRLGDTYIDISAVPGAQKSTLSGDSKVENITFPAGFTFPFGTSTYSAIQVSSNGTAGFNTANTGSGGYSTAMGGTNTARYVNFNLYGADLDNTKNSPAGELWYGMTTDDLGDIFVVQWKNWSWYSSTYNPSSLNFELVLRPNGNFEFRYGTMTAKVADNANGKGAGIGFQFPETGSFGMNVVPHGTVVAGGLANTGFAFDVKLDPNGSVAISPQQTTTYTLTAISGDGRATRDVQVTVWKEPVVNSVAINPVAPNTGKPFQFEWDLAEVTQVRVLDASGAVLCLERDPELAKKGSCQHVETTPGPKSYTVEIANGPIGAPVAVVTRPLSTVVFTALAVDSFEVTPGEFAHAGDPLTLSWSSTGAVMMQILACLPGSPSACTDITPSGADPAAGSLNVTATKSTEYWFYVYDTYTRAAQASKTVWVDIASLDSLTASTTQVISGGPVTLSWTTTDATSVSISPQVPPPAPVEVTATAPFIDISATGTSVPMDGTEDSGRFTVNFPAGFSFPWFGEAKTGLIATTDGWITFDTSYSSASYSNATLPASGTAALAMAALWDDGKAGTNTQLLYQLRDTAEGRHLVIQWKGIGFYATPPDGDLNYQIVLWETGHFDYRYGSMSSSSAGRTDGDSATIGYQSPDRAFAYQFSYNTAVPGGLAHRSWRYQQGLDLDGSLVVNPTTSTTYKVCATNASLYQTCREVRVLVIGAGDLLFSEAMIAPANPEAEWFELRNMTEDPIDLAGWTISAGAGELYPIPGTTPVIVPANGYLVLARSGDPAVNGGLTPALVYGNLLTLDDATDTLSLYMGAMAIDSFTWNSSWTIPANQSIGVDPAKLARNAAANDPATAWCPTTATYGDGTYGGTPGAAGNACTAPAP